MKGANLFADFSKLVNNVDCANVKFLVGPDSEPVYALSHILTARCETFAEMMASAVNNGGKSTQTLGEMLEIPVEDVQPAVFVGLLTYIYTGDIGRLPSADEAFDLYTSAELYELPKLQSQILKQLPSLLTNLHVVLAILRKCQFTFHERVVRTCVEFISIHALEREVLASRGFNRLNGWCVRRIVKDDFFKAPEIEIFRGVVKWAKAQVADDRFVHYLRDSTPALPRPIISDSVTGEDDGEDEVESEESKRIRKMKRCLMEHRLLKAVRFGRIPLNEFVDHIDVDGGTAVQLLPGRMLADVYLYHLNGCERISGEPRHTRTSWSLCDRHVVEWQAIQLAYVLRARGHVWLPGADLSHGCTWTVRAGMDDAGMLSLHFYAKDIRRPVELHKARVVVETGKGELGVKEWVRSRTSVLRWTTEQDNWGVSGLMNVNDLSDPVRIQLRLYPLASDQEDHSDSEDEIVVAVDEENDIELVKLEDIDDIATPIVPRKVAAEGVDSQAHGEEEDDAGFSADVLALPGKPTLSEPGCVSTDSEGGVSVDRVVSREKDTPSPPPRQEVSSPRTDPETNEDQPQDKSQLSSDGEKKAPDGGLTSTTTNTTQDAGGEDVCE